MADYLDKTQSLTPLAQQVICHKATEYPHTGCNNAVQRHGTYLCRCCGLALFRAQYQFSSGCGWPSFDDSLAQTVKESPDKDGRRTEILCARCQAHLGHVFDGEQFTAKNRRHCVNSISLDFVIDSQVRDTEEAIVAGGCFWGVEYFLRKLPGVIKTEVGYIGGKVDNPSYEQVCHHNTGHLEAVRVVFDVAKLNYAAVIRRFFELHDPTQANGQGPDIGSQYQSAVFFYDDNQFNATSLLMEELRQMGYNPVTQILPVKTFWPAEEYHQSYYEKQGKIPYCHRLTPRFG